MKSPVMKPHARPVHPLAYSPATRRTGVPVRARVEACIETLGHRFVLACRHCTLRCDLSKVRLALSHAQSRPATQLEDYVVAAVENYVKMIDSTPDHVVNSALKIVLFKDKDYSRWRKDRQGTTGKKESGAATRAVSTKA